MNIAVLDTDPAHASFTAAVLSSGGYRFQIYTDGRTMLRELERDEFQMIILDWEGGSLGGVQILGWARRHLRSGIPIMFLTDRRSERDMVNALVAGADDYIIRPVSAPLLLASVRKLLRQQHAGQRGKPVEAFGKLEFHARQFLVLIDGKPVRLTQKEYELAHVLFRNLNRRVSRRHIARHVWRRAEDEISRTIDTHVSNVRNKLGLHMENGYCLSAVYGYGYELREVGS